MYFCNLAIPNKNKTLRTNLYLSGSYKTWSQGPVRLFIQEIAPPYSVPFCPENRPTLQRALLYRKSPYPRLSHFIQEIAPPLNMPFYPENRATLQHSVFPYDEWDNASQLSYLVNTARKLSVCYWMKGTVPWDFIPLVSTFYKSCILHSSISNFQQLFLKIQYFYLFLFCLFRS